LCPIDASVVVTIRGKDFGVAGAVVTGGLCAGDNSDGNGGVNDNDGGGGVVVTHMPGAETTTLTCVLRAASFGAILTDIRVRTLDGVSDSVFLTYEEKALPPTPTPTPTPTPVVTPVLTPPMPTPTPPIVVPDRTIDFSASPPELIAITAVGDCMADQVCAITTAFFFSFFLFFARLLLIMIFLAYVIICLAYVMICLAYVIICLAYATKHSPCFLSFVPYFPLPGSFNQTPLTFLYQVVLIKHLSLFFTR
jgi:hypothetical protein